jgi:pimeloyl-ACP methyl ester carboxylesterase
MARRSFVRGYGTTRFLSGDTLRNGQQAALAADVIALMDALGIDTAVLAGFDWRPRSNPGASCASSAAAPGAPASRARPSTSCRPAKSEDEHSA